MEWLLQRFDDNPDKVALVHDQEEYHYAALSKQIDKYTEQLSSIDCQNKTVILYSDYSFFSISLLIALIKQKCIIAPVTKESAVNLEEKKAELNNDLLIECLSDGELVIKEEENSNEDQHELIRNLVKGNHAGLILFSSGSTGKPKAMIHNFDNLLSSFESKKIRSMRLLVFLMFDHIGGLNTLFNCLAMTATLILPTHRDPDYICELIEKNKVQILPASPTFLNLILMSGALDKYDLSSLRMITYGTEQMSESLLLRLKESFPKVKLLQTFGTSETGIANISSKSSSSTFLKIDDPNLEYKIIDSELWLRSKTQIMGYLNASMQRFTDDGWFKTGDLVEETDDGYIRIIGRNSEVINVGGEKLLPIEVETVLMTNPEVLDASVYGASHLITGQTVVADVVIKSSENKKGTIRALRNYCRERLERYKVPTKINVKEGINYSNRFKKVRKSIDG